MGFPYIFESNFETGDNSEWDSETDAGTPAQLDIAHYRTMAGMPGQYAPFSGAYCARWTLAGITDEAYLVAGAIDIGDGVTRWIRFSIYFGEDFTGTANEVMNVFEAISSGATAQAVAGIVYTASSGAILFGIGGTGATPSAPARTMERGIWYTVELEIAIDSGGSGTVSAYITAENELPSETANVTVSSQTNAAVTTGHLGTKDVAATTTGTILMDDFAMDDERLYPPHRRWREELILTKSAHAFVGPGKVKEVELLSGGSADNVLVIYDTDRAETAVPSRAVLDLRNTVAEETVQSQGDPIRVHHGCFVELSGSDPRARVRISPSIAFGSTGAIRNYGRASR